MTVQVCLVALCGYKYLNLHGERKRDLTQTVRGLPSKQLINKGFDSPRSLLPTSPNGMVLRLYRNKIVSSSLTVGSSSGSTIGEVN